VPRRANIRPEEPGRGRIQQSALELFGERGFDATSISEIGDRAGIAKSVLYHHFGSKAELYEAVCAAQTADLLERVRSALPSDAAEPRLRSGVDAYLEFLAERPAAWRLLLRETPAEPALAEIHQRFEAERSAALIELLASRTKRTTKALHLDLVATAIRAFAGWWYDHPEVPREQITDAIVAFARAGAEGITA
jgi:AcrR family transcriptional regulator